MRHPFQTDTFNPGDPKLVNKTEQGKRLHEGFHIGASAWEVDGCRWILMHGPYPYPCPYQFGGGFHRLLTYPLPETYGEEPHKAMNDFERDWNLERKRLWSLEPPPPAPEAPARPLHPQPLHQNHVGCPRADLSPWLAPCLCRA
jgi:hypothetical protein